jgi:hypothetical protein
LAPVLATGIDVSTLSGPLTGLNALSCDVPAQVHQLVSDIAQELDIPPNNASSYQKYVDALVLQSKRSKRSIKQQKKVETSENNFRPAKKPANIKYYFLAGCGVGNNIALLPLPPRPDNSVGELDEFLESLKKIGVQDKSIIDPLLEVRNKFVGPAATDINDEEARLLIGQFFAAISALPDVIQDKSSTEGYQWFKFGQLIYVISTLAVVDSEDKSIVTSIMALESLTERMNLPQSLSQEIAKFIRTAKSRKSKNQVFESANRMALAVYSMY